MVGREMTSGNVKDGETGVKERGVGGEYKTAKDGGRAKGKGFSDEGAAPADSLTSRA